MYMTVTLMLMCKPLYSDIRPGAHSLLATKLQFSHNKGHNVRSLEFIATGATCMRQVWCPMESWGSFAWIHSLGM